MRRILVPFDGSENAKRALQHAIGLAKREPLTELHIVRVFEPPVLREDDVKTLTARAHFEDHLDPAMGIARAAGVKATGEVLLGGAATALAEYARSRGCDEIVMGTRGMGALGNLLMGSVATKVLHLVTVPVTLVK